MYPENVMIICRSQAGNEISHRNAYCSIYKRYHIFVLLSFVLQFSVEPIHYATQGILRLHARMHARMHTRTRTHLSHSVYIRTRDYNQVM